MPLQVEREELEPCRVALTIHIPAERTKRTREAIYQRELRKVSLPGFRRGKVPPQMAKRYVDERDVDEAAVDQAIRDALKDALAEQQVTPLRGTSPSVEIVGEANPAEGFTVKATVALPATVTLGDIDGFVTRRVVSPPTEEDIERALAEIAERLGTYQPTDEPAAEGDRLRATIEITVDGEVDPAASFSEPTIIQVGSNLDAVDAELVGMKAGEEKRFEFGYPPEPDDEARSERPATCHVAVQEVFRLTPVVLNDDVAKDLRHESLEALREAIRLRKLAVAEALADHELERSLLGELVKRSRISLPDEMIERISATRLHELLQTLEQRKITLDMYLSHRQISFSDLQNEVREQAIGAASYALVVNHYAAAEGITVDHEEVSRLIRGRAEDEGVKVSRMQRTMSESGELEQFEDLTIRRQVTASLRQKAVVRELTG